MKRHKTKWTWASLSGGVIRFATEEDARAHAFEYGGLGIYPPIYAWE